VALLGRSGAGKSTLLGTIHARLAEQAALGPQRPCLVGPLSVFHNVAMGRLDRHSTLANLRTLVRPRRAELEAVRTLLEPLGLGGRLRDRASVLSGGEQQRVSVARALHNGRPLLLADEPVSALDAVQADAVLRIMLARHRTAVVALHDLRLALAHADRVVVLHAGQVVLDAPSAGLHPAGLARFYAG